MTSYCKQKAPNVIATLRAVNICLYQILTLPVPAHPTVRVVPNSTVRGLFTVVDELQNCVVTLTV